MNLHQNPPIYAAHLAPNSSGYTSLCLVVKPEKTSTSTPNQIRTIKIPINKIWMLSLVADFQIHCRFAAQNRINHTPGGIILFEKDSA